MIDVKAEHSIRTWYILVVRVSDRYHFIINSMTHLNLIVGYFYCQLCFMYIFHICYRDIKSFRISTMHIHTFANLANNECLKMSVD